VLRQFAAAAVVAACLAGGWLLWNQHAVAAAVVLALGTAAGLLGLLQPRWLRWPYVVFTILTFPIGWAVSHLVLAIIYFGLIAPLGLVLRCCGRQPLAWKCNADGDTYWQPRPPEPKAKSYLRQY
jgi:hypothetical protein